MQTRAAILVALIAVAANVAPFSARAAGLTLVKGPTPIARGSCVHEGDLTVLSPYYAVSYAVETPPPWGIPQGAILDAAPVRDGRIDEDRIGFIDFLPDSWNTWRNTEHRVEVLSATSRQAEIRVTRDFLGHRVATTYVFRGDSPDIDISAVITTGSQVPGRDVESGFSLCTRHAHVFGPLAETAAPEWVAGYGPDWVVGLVFRGADSTVGGNSWRDLYHRHRLAPGATYRYTATLTIRDRSDVAGVHALHRGLDGEALGEVTGSTSPARGTVPTGTIVSFEQRGETVAWTGVDPAGRFAARLPYGDYLLRASAPNHGWTDSATVHVDSTPVARTLGTLPEPGTVLLSITRGDQPTAARIIPEGSDSVIAFLRAQVTFTVPANRGEAKLMLPPGEHLLRIEGGGISVAPRRLRLAVEPGGQSTKAVHLRQAVDLAAAGWFCADLHHHTDLADGATAPHESVLSQEAAGLALATVTDHDLVANHGAVLRAAAAHRMPVILGIEVSPTWGHFNLFPLAPGEAPDCPSGSTYPAQVFTEARRLGANIQVNHAWEGRNSYFRSWLTRKVPGTIRTDFQYVEMNADGGFGQDDLTALTQAWQQWNDGARYVITAGSDTHDVFSRADDEYSGAGQTCVYLGKRELTTDAWFAALNEGRAVATLGPAVTVTPTPGTALRAGTNLMIRARAYASRGLARADVVADGKVVATHNFKVPDGAAQFSITVPTAGVNWLQLIVYDTSGRPAVVNPWWVE